MIDGWRRSSLRFPPPINNSFFFNFLLFLVRKLKKERILVVTFINFLWFEESEAGSSTIKIYIKMLPPVREPATENQEIVPVNCKINVGGKERRSSSPQH